MMNQQAISFQSASIDSSSEMIPMGGYFAPPSMFFPRKFQFFCYLPCLNGTRELLWLFLLDSVAGVTNDTELAVEWSIEEQYILKDGLEKYKKVPNILKYIKIAATLPDKTVRDVALRSRWMQLQDNIDLFVHANNNITAMLNDMRYMPGLVSHMLPLPVSVNEDLANSMMGDDSRLTKWDQSEAGAKVLIENRSDDVPGMCKLQK